jgi:hypothetical protein
VPAATAGTTDDHRPARIHDEAPKAMRHPTYKV